MPLPSVSVVIPTYNASAWISATLESVLRQTYPADMLEVIVVDDASPDDTANLAEAYLRGRRLRGRVIHRHENRGTSATRNEGWHLASGDWIQFLDQDDLLAPHKIQLQAELATTQRETVAVVYSNFQRFVLVDGNWRPSGDLIAPVVDDDPVLRILQEPQFGYVGPSLVRKAFLERVGGFWEVPNLGEDLDLMLRIAMAGGEFRHAHSEFVTLLYRQRPGSLWQIHLHNVEAMRHLLMSIRRTEEFLRAGCESGALSEAARLALAGRYWRFADFYAEFDPQSFRRLMSWLKQLGFDSPIDMGPKLMKASRLIGFENAVRLRSIGRRLGMWRRPW
jgi:glycosyltransferase involved in cell wall biosynthesis